MKRSDILVACGALSMGGTGLLNAEVESEIPFGIEGATGIHSDYVHRGFRLAETSLDFQLASEIALNKEASLHLGLSHLAESGDNFFETAGYLEVDHQFAERFTAGASLTYRDRHESLLAGGFDLGLFTTVALNEDWRWRGFVNVDFGVEGIYGASELEWSTLLNDDSFLTITGGVSAVSDYLDRDGMNDFYTRIALTYALSEQVSLSPFLGTSLQLADTGADDVLYGGFWFEVIF